MPKDHNKPNHMNQNDPSQSPPKEQAAEANEQPETYDAVSIWETEIEPLLRVIHGVCTKNKIPVAFILQTKLKPAPPEEIPPGTPPEDSFIPSFHCGAYLASAARASQTMAAFAMLCRHPDMIMPAVDALEEKMAAHAHDEIKAKMASAGHGQEEMQQALDTIHQTTREGFAAKDNGEKQ